MFDCDTTKIRFSINFLSHMLVKSPSNLMRCMGEEGKTDPTIWWLEGQETLTKEGKQ